MKEIRIRSGNRGTDEGIGDRRQDAVHAAAQVAGKRAVEHGDGTADDDGERGHEKRVANGKRGQPEDVLAQGGGAKGIGQQGARSCGTTRRASAANGAWKESAASTSSTSKITAPKRKAAL
jgi:hypothetical protein